MPVCLVKQQCAPDLARLQAGMNNTVTVTDAPAPSPGPAGWGSHSSSVLFLVQPLPNCYFCYLFETVVASSFTERLQHKQPRPLQAPASLHPVYERRAP